MRFLLALLIAFPVVAETRVGGMGMTVILPAGWHVVPPDEMPTPAPFNRVVVIKGDSATIQISRGAVPIEIRGQTPVELLKRLRADSQPGEMTVAGIPAAKAGDMLVAVHGESVYLFVFSGDESKFDEVLKSVKLSDEPIRIANAGISMVLPDGWRQLESKEGEELRPEMKPQNAPQLKVAEDHTPNGVALIMKRDFAGSSLSASVQVFRKPMLPKLKFASSIELARVIAAATRAGFRGTFEVDPREITVSGFPAAEYGQRYALVDTSGSHDMRAQFVVVSRGTYYYLIGYAGPVEDTADAEVFRNVVVKSLKLAAK